MDGAITVEINNKSGSNSLQACMVDCMFQKGVRANRRGFK
jgi:hypothetical protein